MFIQLSRFQNSFGDTEPVFVNPRQIECFFPFKDTQYDLFELIFKSQCSPKNGRAIISPSDRRTFSNSLSSIKLLNPIFWRTNFKEGSARQPSLLLEKIILEVLCLS